MRDVIKKQNFVDALESKTDPGRRLTIERVERVIEEGRSSLEHSGLSHKLSLLSWLFTSTFFHR